MIVVHQGKGIGKYIDALQMHAPRIYNNIICPLSALGTDRVCYYAIKNEIKNTLNQSPFPLFKLVQIETINKCNSDCSFCPANRNIDPRPLTFMERTLFLSIIEQLQELNYSGCLELFSNNEPLLDSRIMEFSEIARNALPSAVIKIFTNGILLSVEKFEKMIPYLNILRIDNYSEDGKTLIAPVACLYDYIKDKEKYRNKVEIVTIKKNAIRSTRGGLAKNRNKVYFLKSPCIYPFSQITVRPDGKVSLCCNDAYGNYTLGDVTTQTLSDIWNGDSYWSIRREILKGRDRLPMCKKCDVFQIESATATKLYHLLRDGTRWIT
jgi:radical SAM protein with 4Fe4S-binding SPASM domain